MHVFVEAEQLALHALSIYKDPVDTSYLLTQIAGSDKIFVMLEEFRKNIFLCALFGRNQDKCLADEREEYVLRSDRSNILFPTGGI